MPKPLSAIINRGRPLPEAPMSASIMGPRLSRVMGASPEREERYQDQVQYLQREQEDGIAEATKQQAVRREGRKTRLAEIMGQANDVRDSAMLDYGRITGRPTAKDASGRVVPAMDDTAWSQEVQKREAAAADEVRTARETERKTAHAAKVQAATIEEARIAHQADDPALKTLADTDRKKLEEEVTAQRNNTLAGLMPEVEKRVAARIEDPEAREAALAAARMGQYDPEVVAEIERDMPEAFAGERGLRDKLSADDTIRSKRDELIRKRHEAAGRVLETKAVDPLLPEAIAAPRDAFDVPDIKRDLEKRHLDLATRASDLQGREEALRTGYDATVAQINADFTTRLSSGRVTKAEHTMMMAEREASLIRARGEMERGLMSMAPDRAALRLDEKDFESIQRNLSAPAVPKTQETGSMGVEETKKQDSKSPTLPVSSSPPLPVSQSPDGTREVELSTDPARPARDLLASADATAREAGAEVYIRPDFANPTPDPEAPRPARLPAEEVETMRTQAAKAIEAHGKRVEELGMEMVGEVEAGKMDADTARAAYEAKSAEVLGASAAEVDKIKNDALNGALSGRMSVGQAREIAKTAGTDPAQFDEQLAAVMDRKTQETKAKTEMVAAYSDAAPQKDFWTSVQRSQQKQVRRLSGQEGAAGVGRALVDNLSLAGNLLNIFRDTTGKLGGDREGYQAEAIAARTTDIRTAIDETLSRNEAAASAVLARYPDLSDTEATAMRLEAARSAVAKGKIGLEEVSAGLMESPEQYLPFVGDLVGVSVELAPVISAAMKARRGEDLNATDEYFLEAYIEGAGRDHSALGLAAEIVTQLPAFGAEIALTGGVGSAARVGGAKLARKVIGEEVADGVAAWAAKRAVTRGASRLGASLVGITAQTPFAMADKIAADLITKTMIPDLEGFDGDVQEWAKGPGMGFGHALAQSGYDAWVEMVSESAGGLLRLPSGLTNRLAKSAWIRAAAKLNPANSTSVIGKIARRAQLNGPIGEIFEERFGDAMRGTAYALSDGDIGEEFAWPTPDQWAGEALGMLAGNGAFAAINARATAEGKRANQRLFEQDHAPVAAFGDWSNSTQVAEAINGAFGRNPGMMPYTPEEIEAIEAQIGPLAELPAVRRIADADQKLGEMMDRAAAMDDLDTLGRATSARVAHTRARVESAMQTVAAHREAGRIAESLAGAPEASMVTGAQKLAAGRPIAELTAAERAVWMPEPVVLPDGTVQAPPVLVEEVNGRPIVTDAGKSAVSAVVGENLTTALLPMPESKARRLALQPEKKPWKPSPAPSKPTNGAASPSSAGSSSASASSAPSSNAATSTVGTKTTWRAVGERGTVVELPADAAGSLEDAETKLAALLPMGEMLSPDSVEPPSVRQPSAPRDAEAGSDEIPGLDTANQGDTSSNVAGEPRPLDHVREQVAALGLPPVAARNAEQILGIVEGMGGQDIFEAIEFTTEGETGMEVVPDSLTLRVNLDALAKQVRGANQLVVATIEEIVHAAALRSVDRNKVEAMWRAAPGPLKKIVLQAYRYHENATQEGKSPKEAISDFQMGHELLRMVVQDRAFRAQITEAQDLPTSFTAKLLDLLRDLVSALRKHVGKLDKTLKADFEKQVNAIIKTLDDFGVAIDPDARPAEAKAPEPKGKKGIDAGAGEAGAGAKPITADSQSPNPQVSPSPALLGSTGTAYTTTGEPIEYQWAVVEAGDLVTSHSDSLAPNPVYDQALQGRLRDSAASEASITDIEGNTTFARLSDSSDTASGAPIVGPDLVVESGNGRSIAMRRAYKKSRKNIVVGYRDALLENAGKYGLEPAAVAALGQPVLVRIRRTEVDRAAFAEDANRPTVARLSERETALQDAKNLTPSLLEQLEVSAEGDLYTPANQQFFRQFFRLTVAKGELPGLVDSEGHMTQAGLNRVRNAIFVSAYGQDPRAMSIFERLVEEVDPDQRNVVNAMVASAPEVARYLANVEAGTQYATTFPEDLVAAASAFLQARAEGTKTEDFLAQGEMFAAPRSPEQVRMIRFFDANVRSGRRLATGIRNVLRSIEQAGNPQETGLFADTAAPELSAMVEAGLSKTDLIGAQVQGEMTLAMGAPADKTRYESKEYPYLGPPSEDWRLSGHPEAPIVNPIDPTLGPDEKVDALNALSRENIPLVEKILADLKQREGLSGKYSVKEPDRIQAKASRPSIREEKPWHGVEHVRDGLRFKVSMQTFSQLPEIAQVLKENGVEVVKFDTKKMFGPKEWGWRFVAFDLRFPNGQLVEFYAPVPEMDDKAVKHPNHELFEKWRNVAEADMTPERLLARRKHILTSAVRYDLAFAKALTRMGYSDLAAAEASWNSLVERAGSIMGSNTSISSSAVTNPRLQGSPSFLRSESEAMASSPASDSETSVSGRLGISIITSDTTPESGESQPEMVPFSESLGIPRSLMPQIKTKDHGQFLEELASLGIRSQPIAIKPSRLTPTQEAYHPEKVEKAIEKQKTQKRRILISRDRYILDGHHQYVAARNTDENVDATIILLDAREALAQLARFEGRQTVRESLAMGAPAYAAEQFDLLGYKAPDGGIRRIPRTKPATASDSAKPAAAVTFQGNLFDWQPPAESGSVSNDASRDRDRSVGSRRPGAATGGGKTASDQGGDTGGAIGDLFAWGGGPTAATSQAGDAGQSGLGGSGRPAGGLGGESDRDPGLADAGGTGRPGDLAEDDRPVGDTGGGDAGDGAGVARPPRRGPAEKPILDRPTDPASRNFELPDGFEPSPGGVKARIEANFAAIKLLRTLEEENREATPSEKKALVRYTGWGSFKEGFNGLIYERHKNTLDRVETTHGANWATREYSESGYQSYANTRPEQAFEAKAWMDRWGDLHERLKEELTREEFDAAFMSIANAHYTAAPVIDAVWTMARRAGFRGGRALEPSAGVGHFIGRTPADLADRTQWDAIELDHVTGKILGKLYPEARVNSQRADAARVIAGQGFEDARLPNNSFDLVISNVPFDKIGPGVSQEEFGIAFNLHNYFFARALAKAKPGGLVAFITTHNTMDASIEQRQWLAQHGDLVHAVRLPHTAFKKNAGTEVVTDIILLRKPDGSGRAPVSRDWATQRRVGEQDITHQIAVSDWGKDMTKKAVGEGLLDVSSSWIPVDPDLRPLFAAWAVKRPNSGVIHEALVNALMERITYEEKKRGTGWYQKVGVLKVDFVSPIQANEFFAENPDLVIGTHTLAGSMYGANEYSVAPPEGGEEAYLAALNAAAAATPEVGQAQDVEIEDVAASDRGDREGAYVERDGAFWQVVGKGLEKQDWTPTKEAVFRSWNGVLQATETLLEMEQNPRTRDADLEPARARVNELLDAHIERHGHPSDPNNRTNNHRHLVSDSSGYALIQSLESPSKTVDPKTGAEIYTYEKAAILKGRVLRPVVEPTTAATMQEAYAASMSFRGRVEIDYVADLLSISPEAAREQVLESGLVYEDPMTGLLVDTAEYLSGNVVRKLVEAEKAAREDGRYLRNADALREVKPPEKAPGEINFQLGATWIPNEIYTAFAEEVLGIPGAVVRVEQHVKSVRGSGGSNDWSTADVPAADLFEDLLQDRQTVVWDGRGKDRTVDGPKTALAEAKQAAMRREFNNWIRSTDHEIDGRTVGEIGAEAFNLGVNVLKPPVHRGDWIDLPDQSGEIRLTDHRKSVLARFLTQGYGMMAHGVGSGKTFALIALAHELKRTGKARKPVIVAMNSTVEQFAASYKQAYPQARLLVANPKGNFDVDRRAAFYSQMATGDFDAIILPHSTLKQIPHKPESIQRYFDLLRDELMSALDGAMASGDAEGAKKIRDEIQKLKEKMEKRMAAAEKNRDAGSIPWENMGIDALLVDEAHRFKNAPVVTKMRNLKNLPTGKESDNAISMMMKTADVQSRTGGKHVFFATGTPITNTMAEAYVMVRYLAPNLLKDLGLHSFDDFARTFSETVTKPEATWKGQVQMTTRLAKFVNGSGLINMIRTVFDVALGNEKLGLEVPRVKGGRPQQVVIGKTPPMEAMNDWILDIADAYESIDWKELDEDERKQYGAIPIVTMQAGLAAATDPRLIDPNAPDDPNSKVNRMVDEIARIYHAGAERKITQAIFTDLRNPFKTNLLVNTGMVDGLPFGAEVFDDKGDADKDDKRFDLFVDIKKKLVERGIDPKEIWWPGNENAEKLAEKFAKLDSGEIRVVIGGTEKIGTGVNFQQRLGAVHHLNPPRDMKPAMMEQRNGRIIRQGNLHKEWADAAYIETAERIAGRTFEGKLGARRKAAEAWLLENDPAGHEQADEAAARYDIEIFEYAAENSIDSAIFSMMAAKQGFIAQALSENTAEDEFADPADEVQLAMAEIAARTMGDEDLIRLVEMERTVKEMRLRVAAHGDRIAAIRNKISKNRLDLSYYGRRASAWRSLGDRIQNLFADPKALPSWKYGNFTYDPQDKGKKATPLTGSLERWISDAKDGSHTLHVGDVTFDVELFAAYNKTDPREGRISFSAPDSNGLTVVLDWRRFSGAKSLIQNLYRVTEELKIGEAMESRHIRAAETALADLEKEDITSPFPAMDEYRAMEGEYADLQAKVAAELDAKRIARQERSRERREAKANATAPPTDAEHDAVLAVVSNAAGTLAQPEVTRIWAEMQDRREPVGRETLAMGSPGLPVSLSPSLDLSADWSTWPLAEVVMDIAGIPPKIRPMMRKKPKMAPLVKHAGGEAALERALGNAGIAMGAPLDTADTANLTIQPEAIPYSVKAFDDRSRDFQSGKMISPDYRDRKNCACCNLKITKGKVLSNGDHVGDDCAEIIRGFKRQSFYGITSATDFADQNKKRLGVELKPAIVEYLQSFFPLPKSSPESLAIGRPSSTPQPLNSSTPSDESEIRASLDYFANRLPSPRAMDERRREIGEKTVKAEPGDLSLDPESVSRVDVRREIAAVRDIHLDRMRGQTHEQWDAEADRLIAEDYDGVVRELLDAAKEGRPLDSPAMVKAAIKIIPRIWRHAKSTGDRQDMRDAQALTYAYLEGGTRASYVLGARRDLHKTQAERHVDFLSGIMVRVPTEVRKRAERAPTPAGKQRQIATLRNDLDQARATATGKSAEVEELQARIDKAKVAGSAGLAEIARLNTELSNVKSVQNATTANARATIAELEAEQRANKASIAKLETQLKNAKSLHNASVDNAKASIQRLGKALGEARKQKDRAEILGEAHEARLAKVEAVLRDMGLSLHDIFSHQAVVRLRGSEIVARVIAENFSAPQRAAIRFSLPPEGLSDRQVADRSGVKREAIPALMGQFRKKIEARFMELAKKGLTLADFMAGEGAAMFDVTGRIGETGETLRLGTSLVSDAEAAAAAKEMMAALFGGAVEVVDTRKNKRKPNQVPFDIDNRVHVAQVGNTLRSAIDGGAYDMAYEYWINNILSGPQTHTVNIGGNALNIALEYGLQRWMEAGWNTIVGDPKGATFGEYGPIMRQLFSKSVWGTAFAQASQAWASEESYLAADLLRDPARIGGAEKSSGFSAAGHRAIPDRLAGVGTSGAKDAVGAVIDLAKGKGWKGASVGKTVRIPGRALLFMDTLFKGVVARTEVAGQAYRLGLAQGLTGAALDSHMRAEINKPGSASWHAAVEKAEELTFTNELKGAADGPDGGGVFEQLVKRLQESRTADNTLSPLAATLIGWFFPFIQTPFNIYKAGLRRTPFGLVGIASHLLKQGIVSWREGEPLIKNYGQARLARDLTDQTISMLIFGILWGIVEGDGDDDDKEFLITGSRPYGVDSTGERQLTDRLEGGPMTIRWGKGPDAVRFDYSRLEPFATVLGSVADTLRSIKRMENGAAKVDEMVKFHQYALSQATDKTFLQGIVKIGELMEPGRSTGGNVARTIAQAIVPNLIRQPLRLTDDYARESRTAPWYYHALPLGGFAEPKMDLYGQPMEKGGTPAAGALGPLDRAARIPIDTGLKAAPVPHVADLAIRNWNRTHPEKGEQYFPSGNSITTFKDMLGEKQKLTGPQLAEVERLGGLRLRVELAQSITPAEAANPTEATIEKIRAARARVFSAARDEVVKRPAPPKKKVRSLKDLMGWTGTQ